MSEFTSNDPVVFVVDESEDLLVDPVVVPFEALDGPSDEELEIVDLQVKFETLAQRQARFEQMLSDLRSGRLGGDAA